ncbi:MAG: hypothetical protein KatS3mg081_2817 [Gemmatimonadales bacterium]|nr:hypothetical protein HRbin33_01818 [bacterium HR33]GIW53462.1 MAG: hypothetical protein KatS3mg081_2817 [Gemmatimonadales bacterium]
MSLVELAVAVIAAALALGELWFFLGPRPKRQRVRPSAGVIQEIVVTTRNGFRPDTIPVEAGKPVKLLFYRDEGTDGSGRVVIEGAGIDQELPPFKITPVTFTPKEPGDYSFRTDSAPLVGRVVAQVGRDSARSNLGKGHAKHG